MKALLLTSCFITATLLAQAQLPQGKTFIGGNIGYYESRNDNSISVMKSSNFSILPRVGWATRANRMNGIWLGYSIVSQMVTLQETIKTHNIYAGWFQQRFLPIANGFSVFGQGNVGAGYGWRKQYNQKNYNVHTGIGGGLAYMAGNRFLFTVSAPNALGFSMNHSKVSDVNVGGATSSQINFSAEVSSGLALNNMQVGIMVRL